MPMGYACWTNCRRRVRRSTAWGRPCAATCVSACRPGWAISTAQVLLDFAQQYPAISLRVLINDFIGDLIPAEVDVALKITSTPPEDHVARRIGAVRWCLCATPAYWRRARQRAPPNCRAAR